MPITNFPDYLFEIKGKYGWVLDAKGPDEEIKTGKNRQQTYFYAIHPEIDVSYFALCNGHEFILFHISQKEAVLHFRLSEIEKHWKEVEKYLSPSAFDRAQQRVKIDKESIEFDYLARKPLDEIKRIS